MSLSLVLMYMSVVFAQTGTEIRQHLVSNYLTLHEVMESMNLELSETMEKLGFDTITDIGSLGFNFSTCVSPGILFSGSAEEIGISENSLNNFLKLRLRNDVQSLKLCDSDEEAASLSKLYLWLNVWTVGESYPIAYHLDFSTHLTLAPDGLNTPFEASYLGYANVAALEDEIKSATEEAIRTMGIAYLKGVGEW